MKYSSPEVLQSYKEMIVVADVLEDYIRVIPERTTGGTKVYTIEVPEGKELKLETSPDGENFFTLTPSTGKKLVVQITAYVEEVSA